MIILPKTKDGRPITSYSQCEKFHSETGFTINYSPGMYEYFQKYFLGLDLPYNPVWADFGNKVEDAIEKQDFTGFTDEETAHLKTIKPLEVFQQNLVVDFGEFLVTLYIDNCTKDMSVLHDFKTCSDNSIKKYHKDSYKQLELYSLCIKKHTGKMPKKAAVLPIMRKGNPFRGETLEVAGVGDFIEREINKKVLDETEQWLRSTVEQISEYYQVYQKVRSHES